MKNLDFEWLTDEFMLYCRSTQLREKTMSSYEQTLHLFGRWLSDELKIYTVDKITENVIRKYIDDLMVRGKYTFYVNDLSKSKNCPDRRRDYRKPVSVTTINNYIRNIRVFFNWMEREYIIRKNPMKRIRQLKYNRQAKVFLSDEDLKKLLSKFDKSYFTEHRDYVMVMLMLDSGMRLGECSTVLVTDLELGRKRINLRAEETKGRKDRTVYFSPKTEIVLRRWLQFKDRYVESDYLFPVKEHGGSIGVGNFESNFKKYILRAGLNEAYTPHCLRNNFAKRCLMNGMDIFTLSKILGHSSVEVTEQAYLDLTDDDISKQYHRASPMNNF
ncbi:MAG: tyrosine-type recombinase/integrase [Oscillospiraceae bacterium]|nr:tyrosine-type recombinase/integrase [Oscillospiraceae bacterium]